MSSGLAGLGVALIISGVIHSLLDRRRRRLRKLAKGWGSLEATSLETPESRAAIADLTRRD